MNIFVGFSYNSEDNWIKELIFPLIKCFDGTVSTGEDIHGEVITLECVERIKNADGMLAFLTKREKLKSGKFIASRWVTDELSAAISNRVPAIEIRDTKVDSPGGTSVDRQRIVFDIDKKEELILEIAKVLSRWRKKYIPKKLFLLPETIVKDVRPHIRNGNISCTYQFRQGNKESVVYNSKPFQYINGLCLDIYNVPADDALVQVAINGPGIAWCSPFVSVQLLSITLEKE